MKLSRKIKQSLAYVIAKDLAHNLRNKSNYRIESHPVNYNVAKLCVCIDKNNQIRFTIQIYKETIFVFEKWKINALFKKSKKIKQHYLLHEPNSINTLETYIMNQMKVLSDNIDF
jgi:hypothetical protein